MKPPLNKADRANEIIAAKRAKARLEDLVLNKIVVLKSHGFDKYGRVLGELYLNSSNLRSSVNAIMISEGHGYPYDGGTKRGFSI